MATGAFTIRIFVPDGDPEGVRFIDRMGWSGRGIVFPREKWPTIKQQQDFSFAGVYILRGYEEGAEDRPTIYIGEADLVRDRIDSHYKNKTFWDWGIVFTAANLHKAHVRWLEHELVNRAKQAGRCKLDNATEPQPRLPDASDRAYMETFLNEILQILPLAGLRVFEKPKVVVASQTQSGAVSMPANTGKPERDTVVVPARLEGFEEVFIGQKCWRAIRIADAMLSKIKYIAVYQAKPVMAVTHYAPVESIELYGEEGKYQLKFAESAKAIEPIPFADAPSGFMTGTHYTSFQKLFTAKKLTDLFK